MQITLTVDSTGKMQKVKSGNEIDQLFESVKYLSDYADDLALPDVALKLEDVLDCLLQLEGRVGNEVMARLRSQSRVQPVAIESPSTMERRRLVANLHSQG